MGEHVDSKVVGDWRLHGAHLRESGFGREGRFLVEAGTGWLPVFPLCFSLAGVARCRTYDLNRHLTAGMARQTLLHLERHLSRHRVSHGQSGRPREGSLRQAGVARESR